MHSKKIFHLLLFCFVITLVVDSGNVLSAQQAENWRDQVPSVYLDVDGIDSWYVRKEVTFINYVRDRQDADIYIKLTSLQTGSGGREFRLTYSGQLDFKGIDKELKFYVKESDMGDTRKQKIVNMIKIGLIQYIEKTEVAEYIDVSFNQQAEPEKVRDPWNNWVFRVGANGNLGGEQLVKNYSYSFNASINRTTPELKVSLYTSASFNETEFTFESGGISEKIISKTNNKNLSALVARSIGDHWAVGCAVGARSSSFGNTALSATLYPMVEFNLFPYSEFNRRELIFRYLVGYDYVKYDEVTIFDETVGKYFKSHLNFRFSIHSKWGDTGLYVNISHLLNDLSKSNVGLFSYLSLRLVKGLHLNFNGNYRSIRDQMSLPKGGASKEEVLLRIKQLATTYNFGVSAGFSYRFGSIYNNAVNPRLHFD